MVLSGKKKTQNEKSGIFGFFIYRLKKIVPAYYFCIFIVVLVATPVYLSSQWKAIPVYLLFLQNLFPAYCGAINGATWTIALMVQFYLVAPLVYALFCKMKWKLYPVAIVFSTLAKFLLERYITLTVTGNSDIDLYYVIANIRQLPTTIDHFVAGMCVAYFLNKRAYRISGKWCRIICVVLPLLAVSIFLNGWTFFNTVWGPSGWTLVWMPLLGFLVAAFLFFLAQIQFSPRNVVNKMFLFISKYEYNIYLWHMILFSNIFNTEWYQKGLNSQWPFLAVFALIVLDCLFGYAVTLLLKPRKT